MNYQATILHVALGLLADYGLSIGTPIWRELESGEVLYQIPVKGKTAQYTVDLTDILIVMLIAKDLDRTSFSVCFISEGI